MCVLFLSGQLASSLFFESLEEPFLIIIPLFTISLVNYILRAASLLGIWTGFIH